MQTTTSFQKEIFDLFSMNVVNVKKYFELKIKLSLISWIEINFNGKVFSIFNLLISFIFVK